MIKLTRLNGTQFALNCEMILVVEATPDTVISLTDGNKMIVRDTVDEVIQKVIAYKKQITLVQRIE